MDETIKIAVAGNVDSGKSTLAGVLLNKCLDDGRGYCRNLVARNKHEIESGRTSTITLNTMVEIQEDKRKIITFIDLAGHEKYLKTTMYGLTSLFADYGLVLVGANMGITKMTKEHLGILLYLKIPIIVLITKTDICPENIYSRTERIVRKLLKVPIFNKRPYMFLRDEEKCMTELKEFMKLENPLDTFIPVIPISNKTGLNIENLKNYLLSLNPQKHWNTEIEGTIVYIDATYIVKGIGLIISGTVRGNPIKVNQKLWLGPIKNTYIPFKVRSLHNNIRETVDEVTHSNIACIAIKQLGKEQIFRSQITKGVLMFDDNNFKNSVSKQFRAEVLILHHSTTITDNYQPVIHCGSIRQTAKITIENNDTILRTGSKANVKFTFMYKTEYLEIGQTFFFRDGATKGYGTIVEIL